MTTETNTVTSLTVQIVPQATYPKNVQFIYTCINFTTICRLIQVSLEYDTNLYV